MGSAIVNFISKNKRFRRNSLIDLRTITGGKCEFCG